MRGPYVANTTAMSANPWTTKRWYRTDIGQKVRTPLPYQHVHIKADSVHPLLFKTPPTGYSAQWGPAYCQAYVWYPQGFNPVPYWNRALAKLLDKSRSQLQGGTNWAERHQTLRLLQAALRGVRSPLNSVAKAMHRYSRNPGKSSMKDVPNAWLAWHFGVEPLLKDIHSLLERLKDSGKPHQVTASTRSTGTTQFNMLGGKQTLTWNTAFRYSAFFTRTDEQLALLNDFGVLNPAAIAWELVPFSFVADWFYPIGQYLNSLTDLAGYSVANGYRTMYAKAGHMVVPVFYQNSPFYAASGSVNRCSSYAIDRSLVSGFKPVFTTTPKDWSQSLSRAATSIALLLQVLRR